MASVILVLLVAVLSFPAHATEPDTILILTNGAEVRGNLMGFADARYTVLLKDGRTMEYAQAEVERLERLPAANQIVPLESPVVPDAKRRPPVAELCTGTVLVTEGGIDSALYVVISELRLSKKWRWGGAAEIYPDLASEARGLKADAVINTHTWTAPTAWSWAAPHIAGTAVRWTDLARTRVVDLTADCY